MGKGKLKSFLLSEGYMLLFTTVANSGARDRKNIIHNAKTHKCSIINLILLPERSKLLVQVHYKFRLKISFTPFYKLSYINYHAF